MDALRGLQTDDSRVLNIIGAEASHNELGGHANVASGHIRNLGSRNAKALVQALIQNSLPYKPCCATATCSTALVTLKP